MHRNSINRVARAVALTGVLVASPLAAAPSALAASHRHVERHVAMCHRTHCSSHGTNHHVGSAASAHSTGYAGLGRTLSAKLGPARRAPGSSPASTPAGSSASASAPCANADLVPTSSNLPQIAAATLCLVNQQRALDHESPLRDNAHLDSSAAGHSQDMVAQNYYDHVSPTGVTPLDRIQASGYLPSADASSLGENIDAGAYASATPAAIVADWMASPDHRANILNSAFVDSGVGVVAQIPAQFASSQIGATYTQDFGAIESPSGVIS
ncbi:MAG TPA: CAP domain-containing protein [Solirubrobacteraceae bacterium]